MKWFPKRKKTATSPLWRSDGGEARLLFPQMARSAQLPVTVAQVDAFVADAYAKQLQPVIVVTVAGADVATLQPLVPASTTIQIGVPAAEVRDFIDNAVDASDMRAVTLGELLDGWPMRDAWLVNTNQATTSY
ncbi:hypothetical protein [Lacticaseibacillus sp. GG6-2]